MDSIDWGVFSGDLAALILGLTIWLFTKEPAAIGLTLVYAIAMMAWHFQPLTKLSNLIELGGL